MKIQNIHSIAVGLTEKLNKHVNKEGIELQKMVLGMEILLINIPKIIFILILSTFLRLTLHTFIILFSFAFIRRYASGLHASNNINCTFVSFFMFIVIPYLLQDVIINEIILIFIFTFTCFGLYKYAPSDTAAKPILGKSNRDMLKRKAITANIFILFLALLIHESKFFILFSTGVIYGVICILPLTYKILKRSMNNYEKYE